LYPAAYRTVIAVSATDSADRLFAASNRGKHIAVAAPGVDLVLPSPEGKYQVTSGTSFAAAYVSGLAALMIERNPSLTPDGVRAKLTATARDLGPKGPDEQFGAGLADAVGALAAAGDGAPVTAASTGAAAR
jgi:subtilisin family serine protease